MATSIQPETPAGSASSRKLALKLLRMPPAGAVAFSLRLAGLFGQRRVPKMAAVIAFWGLFALPWILLAAIAAISRVSIWLGNNTVEAVEQATLQAVETFLSPEEAREVAVPLLEGLFRDGTAGLGIIGFLVALWAGSKAMMELMESVYLIAEDDRHHGYLYRRLTAFGFLLGGLVALALIAPVAVLGPSRVGEWLDLPTPIVWLIVLLVGLLVAFLLLLALYRSATLVVKDWTVTIPGAILASLVSAVAIVGLSEYIRHMFSSNPFLGVLTTPIALMVCAYVLSLILLGGAVFNFVLDRGAEVDAQLTESMRSLIAEVEDPTEMASDEQARHQDTAKDC